MNYDFIEVGTSDFETHIQNARDETVGLSIEPIQYYLDRLPNKENVEKLNCAVSFDGKPGRDKVYYIPHETIIRQGIPHWIRGHGFLSYWNRKLKSYGRTKVLPKTYLLIRKRNAF